MRLRRMIQDPIAMTLERAGLPADVARRLATAGTPVKVHPGAVLCKEGEWGWEAFVLVTGEAVVEVDGRRERVVAPGEVIGEIAALDPQRRRTATVTVTEESIVLAYDVRTFRALASDIADVLVPDRAA